LLAIFSNVSASATECVFAAWNVEWLDDKEVREDIRNGCLKYKLANPDKRGVGEWTSPGAQLEISQSWLSTPPLSMRT
jgi:hypothetical protein